MRTSSDFYVNVKEDIIIKRIEDIKKYSEDIVKYLHLIGQFLMNFDVSEEFSHYISIVKLLEKHLEDKNKVSEIEELVINKKLKEGVDSIVINYSDILEHRLLYPKSNRKLEEIKDKVLERLKESESNISDYILKNTDTRLLEIKAINTIQEMSKEIK